MIGRHYSQTKKTHLDGSEPRSSHLPVSYIHENGACADDHGEALFGGKTGNAVSAAGI